MYCLWIQLYIQLWKAAWHLSTETAKCKVKNLFSVIQDYYRLLQSFMSFPRKSVNFSGLQTAQCQKKIRRWLNVNQAILDFPNFPLFVNVVWYFEDFSEVVSNTASLERSSFSFRSQGSHTLKSVATEMHLLQPAPLWVHAHTPFSLVTGYHPPPEPLLPHDPLLPQTAGHASCVGFVAASGCPLPLILSSRNSHGSNGLDLLFCVSFAISSGSIPSQRPFA